MILLTFNEWIGPSRDSHYKSTILPTQRLIGMATDLPLHQALRKVKQYQDSYNVRFYPHTAVNFTLIGISPGLDGTGKDTYTLLNEFGAGKIEDLQIYPAPEKLRPVGKDEV